MIKNILGIETSCDETSAAVYNSEKGILSNYLFSQIELHKEYGGVIPEIASRSHLEKITIIVNKALEDANKTLDNIDVIAVTSKPGLPGSLLVGVSFAKALAWAKNIKLIGVDHLEAHVFSSFLEHNVPFPHICLAASGGHTFLSFVEGFGKYKIIGYTLDDAAGEAFDKIAKLLKLPYPGGPVIEKLATEANFEDYFKYSRGSLKGLNFSFSGLKTAVLYDLVNRGFYDLKTKTLLNDSIELKKKVASSLLVCISDIFKKKINLALEEYPEAKAITFVGGVACNKFLRNKLAEFCKSKKIDLFVPSPKYCSDNAAMVSFVGNYKSKQNKFDKLDLDIF